MSAYHRPATLDEALAHLREPGAVALAGGTHLIATGGPPHAVVDLQALGIACIRMHEPDALVLGAMATLDAIAHNDLVPGSLRDAARRERPSTLPRRGDHRWMHRRGRSGQRASGRPADP